MLVSGTEFGVQNAAFLLPKILPSIFWGRDFLCLTVDRYPKEGYTGARWGKVVESRKTFFMGQYEHGLDDKNRLFLPSRFREKSRGADFILTQGLDRCLFLFPTESWHDLAGKLQDLPLANKIEERAFKRILLSAACEADV